MKKRKRAKVEIVEKPDGFGPWMVCGMVTVVPGKGTTCRRYYRIECVSDLPAFHAALRVIDPNNVWHTIIRVGPFLVWKRALLFQLTWRSAVTHVRHLVTAAKKVHAQLGHKVQLSVVNDAHDPKMDKRLLKEQKSFDPTSLDPEHDEITMQYVYDYVRQLK